MSAKTVLVGHTPNEVLVGGASALTLIAGPCVIEEYEKTFAIASFLKNACTEIGLKFIFKASYDKANRTSAHAYRGVGLEKGLEILGKIKSELSIPVLTDVHQIKDVEAVAYVADVIQIPAFLCRQTDLLREVAIAGKPVNIKKGQFLSGADMGMVVEKLWGYGNSDLMLTERGSCFGYHDLVVDFRNFDRMRNLGHPIIFDATHSVQEPGGNGDSSGGSSDFVPTLAKAAVAAGVDGIFIETYPFKKDAPCDGPNSLELDEVPALLKQLVKVREALGTNA